MKNLTSLSLRVAIGMAAAALAFSPSPLQAGGFGGPGPFRNGSPLVSGTDGVYQAVATAKNLTGIIGFSIRDGSQTADQQYNGWTIFLDGIVIKGQTIANISQDKVVGILDSDLSKAFTTSENGTVELPLAFVISENSISGSFSGSINLKSPVAAIKGKGFLKGTPPRTDQIITLEEEEAKVVGSTIVVTGGLKKYDVVIPGSSLGEVEFKVRGSRLSISSSSKGD